MTRIQPPPIAACNSLTQLLFPSSFNLLTVALFQSSAHWVRRFDNWNSFCGEKRHAVHSLFVCIVCLSCFSRIDPAFSPTRLVGGSIYPSRTADIFSQPLQNYWGRFSLLDTMCDCIPHGFCVYSCNYQNIEDTNRIQKMFFGRRRERAMRQSGCRATT